jgi:hypothetical protein
LAECERRAERREDVSPLAVRGRLLERGDQPAEYRDARDAGADEQGRVDGLCGGFLAAPGGRAIPSMS